ncbi:MAG: hypothetical protein HY761_08285 [Candidatus Omnitrophica bacterium]|nr:hypothetical protein [Candidatus Omnitrophota bacterium]
MLRNKISFYFCLKSSVIFVIIFLPLFLFAQQFVYDAKEKRNPFIPLVTPEGRLLQLDKEEKKADLAVEGIIYDKNGRSFALAGGAVLAVGDTFGDYQVLKILEDKVIFIKEGQPYEVYINKEETKIEENKKP